MMDAMAEDGAQLDPGQAFDALEAFVVGLTRNKITDRWTRVYRKTIVQSKTGLEANTQTLEKVRIAATEAADRMREMTGLVRDVFDATA